MDGARDHHVKQNKPDTNITLSLMCGIDLKNNKMTCIKGGLFEGRNQWERRKEKENLSERDEYD
jgi:hypothetical protein